MNLIEKIVDKFLNDSDYAMVLMLFTFFTFIVLTGVYSALYKLNVERDVTLAKIAAGQIVDVQVK